jgi:flagellar protein FliS
MAPSNPQSEYITQRVLGASPMELIRLLYESALQSVDRALRALYSGDILERGRSINRAIEILTELRASLRHDVHPEYCATLAGLYTYMQSQLVRAHAERSEVPLQEVTRLIQTLLDGWNGAMTKLSAGQDSAAEPEAKPEPLRVTEPEPNRYSTESAAAPSGRSWQL